MTARSTGWHTERRSGAAYRTATRAGTPLKVWADRAITCDDSLRFEWYADEVSAPYRRWSQGVRTWATIGDARKAADDWLRDPSCFRDVART